MTVNCLLDGKDVLAVLPTSFGNSQYFDVSDLGESDQWSSLLQYWRKQEQQLFLFNITH